MFLTVKAHKKFAFERIQMLSNQCPHWALPIDINCRQPLQHNRNFYQGFFDKNPFATSMQAPNKIATPIVRYNILPLLIVSPRIHGGPLTCIKGSWVCFMYPHVQGQCMHWGRGGELTLWFVVPVHIRHVGSVYMYEF
jgi:hypothetical protein